MKAAVIQDGFGIENLAVVDRPELQPGPGQVVVQVYAASLNYRDLLVVQGNYNPKQPLPLIPCSDGAGEVIAVGEGVTRVSVGDRVASSFAQGWINGKPTHEKLMATTLGSPLDGMLAEQVCLSADGVVKIPDHLSYEEAATLPCAAVTAWSALVRHGNLTAGESVLALGTGGVSIFALQLAKAHGASVIITSSSDTKLERAKELGADHVVNYKEDPKWSKAVRKATNGEGVDHIIEVGGVGTMAQSMKCVRMAGNIYLIGVLAGVESPLNMLPVVMQDVRVQGVIVGPRESFEDMNRAIALHQLRPVIDATFPMAESQAALEHMASGKHFGKIVIKVAD
jgi:NADPH:quinone reductase-like Zn-dependent oxidoreductase